MALITWIPGSIFIIATLLSLVRHEAWWIRIFDFPRLQVLLFLLLSAIVHVVFTKPMAVQDIVFLSFMAACILYQMSCILPYTFLYGKQVHDAIRTEEEHNQLSLVITNVLMTNRQSSRCVEMIRKADPDMVLAVETDKWWEKELSVLEDMYPHRFSAPLGNTYGMILFSRLKLQQCDIKYLLSHSIPSVHCTAELKSGVQFRFYGVHPRPPAPAESSTSVLRDAELIMVGKEARNSSHPVIVAGDLNDVAWSRTTRLFQKISGLLDPRIGRGMFPTYNAKSLFFRWPLDHVFHSSHFRVVMLKRLEHINSDHFPIYIKLSYEPEARQVQDTPQADKEDLNQGNEKSGEGAGRGFLIH